MLIFIALTWISEFLHIISAKWTFAKLSLRVGTEHDDTGRTKRDVHILSDETPFNEPAAPATPFANRVCYKTHFSYQWARVYVYTYTIQSLIHPTEIFKITRPLFTKGVQCIPNFLRLKKTTMTATSKLVRYTTSQALQRSWDISFIHSFWVLWLTRL